MFGNKDQILTKDGLINILKNIFLEKSKNTDKIRRV